MNKKPSTKKTVSQKPKEAKSPKKNKVSKGDKNDNQKKSEGKKNTSLRLDKQTLKALKIHAIESDTSIQNLIESLINDYLKKSRIK